MSSVSGVKMLMSDPRIAIPAMAAPLAVAILIQNVNSMADILWVSWLGGSAVGGLGLAYPVYASICGVGNGLAIGVSAAIARYVGVKERENASKAAGQSLFLSIVFSVLIFALCLPTMGPLMDCFGDPSASDAAIAYIMPMFLLGFFIIGGSVMSGILRGEGAARASMVIQVAGAATNIVLDPIIIYGLHMGVAGAGWATVIAGLVSLVLGLMCYRRGSGMYVTLRVRDMAPSMRFTKEILVVGLPQAAEYVVMSVINIPMNFIIVGVAGADTVGVYTSAWRVAYVALVPAQAYSGAVVSVCSAEYSSRHPEMIKAAYRFGVRRSVIHTVYLSIVLALLAYPLAMVFTAADDLQYLRNNMVLLFIVMACMLPAMSQVFVGSGFLQSLKHSQIALYSSLARNIVMVSGYFAMAVIFACSEAIWVIMGLIEIWGGILMGWLAWKFILRFERSCSSGEYGGSPFE